MTDAAVQQLPINLKANPRLSHAGCASTRAASSS